MERMLEEASRTLASRSAAALADASPACPSAGAGGLAHGAAEADAGAVEEEAAAAAAGAAGAPLAEAAVEAAPGGAGGGGGAAEPSEAAAASGGAARELGAEEAAAEAAAAGVAAQEAQAGHAAAETPLVEIGADTSRPAPGPTPAPPAAGRALEAMSVRELRAEVARRGLDASRCVEKSDLAGLLRSAEAAEVEEILRGCALERYLPRLRELGLDSVASIGGMREEDLRVQVGMLAGHVRRLLGALELHRAGAEGAAGSAAAAGAADAKGAAAANASAAAAAAGAAAVGASAAAAVAGAAAAAAAADARPAPATVEPAALAAAEAPAAAAAPPAEAPRPRSRSPRAVPAAVAKLPSQEVKERLLELGLASAQVADRTRDELISMFLYAAGTAEVRENWRFGVACVFFDKGKCKKGAECWFRHVEAPQQAAGEPAARAYRRRRGGPVVDLDPEASASASPRATGAGPPAAGEPGLQNAEAGVVDEKLALREFHALKLAERRALPPAREGAAAEAPPPPQGRSSGEAPGEPGAAAPAGSAEQAEREGLERQAEERAQRALASVPGGAQKLAAVRRKILEQLLAEQRQPAAKRPRQERQEETPPQAPAATMRPPPPRPPPPQAPGAPRPRQPPSHGLFWDRLESASAGPTRPPRAPQAAQPPASSGAPEAPGWAGGRGEAADGGVSAHSQQETCALDEDLEELRRVRDDLREQCNRKWEEKRDADDTLKRLQGVLVRTLEEVTSRETEIQKLVTDQEAALESFEKAKAEMAFLQTEGQDPKGGPSAAEVEEFIRANEVDIAAASQLRESTPRVQRVVLNRGSFKNVLNNSSALLARIRDARQGNPDGGADGMLSRCAMASATADLERVRQQMALSEPKLREKERLLSHVSAREEQEKKRCRELDFEYQKLSKDFEEVDRALALKAEECQRLGGAHVAASAADAVGAAHHFPGCVTVGPSQAAGTVITWS